MKRVFSIVLAVACALSLTACIGGSEKERAPSSPSATAEPGPVPVEDGTPGAPIRQGFKVAEGTRLVDAATDRENEDVKGWFATLLIEPDADLDEIADAYRSQLSSLGYTIKEDTQQETPKGSRSIRGERLGTLPGATGSVPVDLAQVSVVPSAGEIPGHVQLLVTVFKAANQSTG